MCKRRRSSASPLGPFVSEFDCRNDLRILFSVTATWCKDISGRSPCKGAHTDSIKQPLNWFNGVHVYMSGQLSDLSLCNNHTAGKDSRSVSRRRRSLTRVPLNLAAHGNMCAGNEAAISWGLRIEAPEGEAQTPAIIIKNHLGAAGVPPTVSPGSSERGFSPKIKMEKRSSNSQAQMSCHTPTTYTCQVSRVRTTMLSLSSCHFNTGRLQTVVTFFFQCLPLPLRVWIPVFQPLPSQLLTRVPTAIFLCSGTVALSGRRWDLAGVCLITLAG